MFNNTLKEKLINGEVVFGTWMVIPSPTLVEIFGLAGMDFVVIDHEHGPFSYETSENMIRAAENSGCTPLIRVPTNSASDILRSLEIGAHGIIVPQVDTFDQANFAIKSMKYSPRGERGVSAFTRASSYYGIGEKNRTKKSNDSTLSMLLIESIEAINNLDAILECKDIDIIYIGTYDLSQSLGIIDDVNNEKVLSIIKESVLKIRKAGVAAGILAQSSEDAKRWIDIGVQFVPYIADCGIIHEAVSNKMKILKGL